MADDPNGIGSNEQNSSNISNTSNISSSNIINTNNINQSLNNVNNQINTVTNDATQQFKKLEEQVQNLNKQLNNMNFNSSQFNEFFNTLSNKIKELEKSASEIKIDLNTDPNNIQQMLNPFIEQIKVLLGQALDNIDIFHNLPDSAKDAANQVHAAFNNLDLGLAENVQSQVDSVSKNLENLAIQFKNTQAAMGGLVTDIKTNSFGDFDSKLLIGDLKTLEDSFKTTQSHVIDFYKAFSDINPDMAKNIFPQMFQQLKSEIPATMSEIKKLFEDPNFTNDPKMLEQYNEYFNKINKIISEQAQNINNGFKEISPTLDPKSISYMQDVYKDFLKTMESFGILNKDALSRLTPNSEEFKDLENKTNQFKALTDSVKNNKEALYEINNVEKEVNDQLNKMTNNYENLGNKAKSTWDNMKSGVSDFLAPLSAVEKGLGMLGLAGIPITAGGIKQFGAGTIDYYNKQAQWTSEAARAELATGNAFDITGAQSRILNTGTDYYNRTHGMIGFEEYNKSYINLAQNVGGQYGISDQQSISDLNKINDQTFAMTKVYNINESTTAEFVKTFYKELRLGAGETADVMSRLTQSATSSNVPVDQYIKSVASLAMQFRGVGLSGQEAVNAMDNMMSRGMTFQQAQGMSSAMGGAVGKMADNYGMSAYTGIMAGQAKDPFEAIAQGIERYTIKDGKLTQTEGYGARMAERLDYQLNMMGNLSGGNTSAQTKIIYDTLKSQGFSSDQASQGLAYWKSGDKNLFSNFLEKEKPGGKSAEELTKESVDKLSSVADLLSGQQKAQAENQLAQYKAAGILKDPLDKLYGGIQNLIKALGDTTTKLLQSSLPALNNLTGGLQNLTGGIGGTELLVGGAGLLGAAAGTKYLAKKGMEGLSQLGKKVPTSAAEIGAITEVGTASATAEAGFLSKLLPKLKTGGKVAAGTAAAAGAGYLGYELYQSLFGESKKSEATTTSDKLYNKVDDIYKLLTLHANNAVPGGFTGPGGFGTSSSAYPIGTTPGIYPPGTITGPKTYEELIQAQQSASPTSSGYKWGDSAIGGALGAFTGYKAISGLASGGISKVGGKLGGPLLGTALTLGANLFDPITHSFKGDSVEGDYKRGLLNSGEGIAESAAMLGGPLGWAGIAGWEGGKAIFDYTSKDKTTGKGGLQQLEETGGFGVGLARLLEGSDAKFNTTTALPEQINDMRQMKSQFGVSEEQYKKYADTKLDSRDAYQKATADPMYNIYSKLDRNVNLNETEQLTGSLNKLLSDESVLRETTSNKKDFWGRYDLLKNNKQEFKNQAVLDEVEKSNPGKREMYEKYLKDPSKLSTSELYEASNISTRPYDTISSEAEGNIMKQKQDLQTQTLKDAKDEITNGNLKTVENLIKNNNISNESKVLLGGIFDKIGNLQASGAISDDRDKKQLLEESYLKKVAPSGDVKKMIDLANQIKGGSPDTATVNQFNELYEKSGNKEAYSEYIKNMNKTVASSLSSSRAMSYDQLDAALKSSSDIEKAAQQPVEPTQGTQTKASNVDSSSEMLKRTLGSASNPFSKGTLLSGISPMLSSSYMNNDPNSRINYLGVMKEILNQGGDEVVAPFGNIEQQTRTNRAIMDSTIFKQDRFGTDLPSRLESTYKTAFSGKDNIYSPPSDAAGGGAYSGLKQANIQINASRDLGKKETEELVNAIKSVLKGYDVKINQHDESLSVLEKNAVYSKKY